MRRKAISFEQAKSLQKEVESLLEGAEFESDCSAYDCEFVALALKLETKLLTKEP